MVHKSFNMETLFFIIVMVGFFLLIKGLGNKLNSNKWAKKCPNCGHQCKPTETSRLYWKGSGGRPAYFYHCPKCGLDFDNR